MTPLNSERIASTPKYDASLVTAARWSQCRTLFATNPTNAFGPEVDLSQLHLAEGAPYRLLYEGQP
jgi:hypothetical protein